MATSGNHHLNMLFRMMDIMIRRITKNGKSGGSGEQARGMGKGRAEGHLFSLWCYVTFYMMSLDYTGRNKIL